MLKGRACSRRCGKPIEYLCISICGKSYFSRICVIEFDVTAAPRHRPTDIIIYAVLKCSTIQSGKRTSVVHMIIQLLYPSKQTRQRIHVHIKDKVAGPQHLALAVVRHAQNFKRGRREQENLVMGFRLP